MTQSRRSSQEPQPVAAGLTASDTGMLLAGVVMMIIGWGGLYWLWATSLPRIGGELWLFFALLQIAVTGTAIPLIRLLYTRLIPFYRGAPSSGVVMRQSIWVGLFVVVCAWLQIPRSLSLPIVFFIALVFILLELFLRFRERFAGQ